AVHAAVRVLARLAEAEHDLEVVQGVTAEIEVLVQGVAFRPDESWTDQREQGSAVLLAHGIAERLAHRRKRIVALVLLDVYLHLRIGDFLDSRIRRRDCGREHKRNGRHDSDRVTMHRWSPQMFSSLILAR